MDDLSWLLFVLEKITNTYGKDSKYTNAIDIIWLYCWVNWRLYCLLNWRLYCRLYCWLNWRLNWGLYYAISLLFFFSECSKLIALGNTSGMFFSCYCFFFFLCNFYLTQNPWECSCCIYKYACFNFFNCPLEQLIHHSSTHCFCHVSF